jgi:class 3 adenylate cyclase/pimeloyl-ACP methyl ester carboxylesterase
VPPETQYARSGEVSIAYQVLGDGPFDVVFVPAAVSHVELVWEVLTWRLFLESLAAYSRVIHFDKRGTGMSDRVVGAPSLETRMDDVRAVMDAAGSQRAAILGLSEGVPMSALFAATYPDRTWALVLYGGMARELWAPDYPWGRTEAEAQREIAEARLLAEQGSLGEEEARSGMPTATAEEVDAFIRMFRQGISPGALEALDRMNIQIDVRAVLPAINVPTLVLHNTRDRWVEVERGRDLAQRIPGARFVEFPIEGHITPGAEMPPVLAEIKSFLEGVWKTGGAESEPERMLATVMFTDIAGSTAKAAELGDARWRELLERHHVLIRRQLAQARGREVATTGDGFLAAFDGPARAIRCACAITEAVKALGLEVRVGLHTGECEVVGGNVAGIAVHTGARVASKAEPGEVLVSSTVKDLVAGSGLQFRDRGTHELRGVPGEWHLYAVAH